MEYESLELPPEFQAPIIARTMKHANIFHRRALYDALVKRKIGDKYFVGALPNTNSFEELPPVVSMPHVQPREPTLDNNYLADPNIWDPTLKALVREMDLFGLNQGNF